MKDINKGKNLMYRMKYIVEKSKCISFEPKICENCERIAEELKLIIKEANKIN